MNREIDEMKEGSFKSFYKYLDHSAIQVLKEQLEQSMELWERLKIENEILLDQSHSPDEPVISDEPNNQHILQMVS